MNVILLEKIKNLGHLGDTVKVKPGYGRNYLIPQGKALPATKANLEIFQSRREELEQRALHFLSGATKRLAQLKLLAIKISARAGDEGKLYGSIGAAEITSAVSEAGVELEKKEVFLPKGALRYLGVYEIQVRLHE